jgi:Nucleotidyltransferase domain
MTGALVDLQRPLATVTPTLDGDVLAVLSRSDAAFTTGQLHRVLPDFSEEGIRRVLGRLTHQGIVTSARAGNAYLYRLNRDHLAAGPILVLAGLKAALITRLTGHLNTWTIPPVYAAMFGSVATGSSTSNSDLDLLLVHPTRTRRDQWDSQISELTATVTRWTGNDTRPLEYSAAELIGKADEPVLRDIVADGLTVAGDRAWLVRQLHKKTA